MADKNKRRLIENILFSTPYAKLKKSVHTFLLIAIFTAGVLHWVAFFNRGNLSLTSDPSDWIKESVYLNTLREAQERGIIPWAWEEPYYQTANFLGNPEIILTPDVLLLRRIDNPTFFLIHILLFYTLGFAGSILLARKLDLNFVSFLVFWLLFNFNGYIVSHLAIGHIQWAGYFLLPFIFTFLLSWIKFPPKEYPERTQKTVFSAALTLSLLFWNGSLHIAILSFIFIYLTLLFSWNLFGSILKTTALSILLSAGRLLPAALSFWKKNLYGIHPGYPNFSFFIKALTTLRDFNYRQTRGLTWWEFDIYIGCTALAILAIMLIIRVLQKGKPLPLSIIFAAGIMFILSFGKIYLNLANSQIPFYSAVRIPSRFIIFPAMILFIIGTTTLAQLIKKHKFLGYLALLSTPVIAYELARHSFLWRVIRLETDTPTAAIPNIEIAQNVNTLYQSGVIVGWLVSLLTLSGIIYFVLRKKIYANKFST